MFSRLGEIREQVLGYIYPPKCIACDKITDLHDGKYVCSDCKEFFKYIDGETCRSCGVSGTYKNGVCKNCKNNLFTRNVPIFVYDGMVQEIIHRFKYGKQSYLHRGIGSLMLKKLLKTPNLFDNLHYIAPVPIHKNRMKQRGFNQAELLAKEISKASEIPMIKNLIIRIKDTKPQAQLSVAARENNLKDAFIANRRYELEKKNILLVDDIYTTGSTLNACCKVLHEAGATNVVVTTFSITSKK